MAKKENKVIEPIDWSDCDNETVRYACFLNTFLKSNEKKREKFLAFLSMLDCIERGDDVKAKKLAKKAFFIK